MSEYSVVGFWSRVRKTDSCWLWIGAKDQKGYGIDHIKKDGRWVSKRAHIIPKLLNGEIIPVGYECDHLCEIKSCVRPEHISITTRRMNILRSNNAAAKNNKKSHCSRGHKFVDGSFYYYFHNRKNTTLGDGAGYTRVCKACTRIRQNKWRNKLKR